MSFALDHTLKHCAAACTPLSVRPALWISRSLSLENNGRRARWMEALTERSPYLHSVLDPRAASSASSSASSSAFALAPALGGCDERSSV